MEKLESSFRVKKFVQEKSRGGASNPDWHLWDLQSWFLWDVYDMGMQDRALLGKFEAISLTGSHTGPYCQLLCPGESGADWPGALSSSLHHVYSDQGAITAEPPSCGPEEAGDGGIRPSHSWVRNLRQQPEESQKRELGKGVGSLSKIRTAVGDPGAWSSYLITGFILNVEKPILFLIKKIYCPPISNSNFSGMDFFFFCQCLYSI